MRANLSTLPTQLRDIVINTCVTFGKVNLLQIVHIPLSGTVNTKSSNKVNKGHRTHLDVIPPVGPVSSRAFGKVDVLSVGGKGSHHMNAAT